MRNEASETGGRTVYKRIAAPQTERARVMNNAKAKKMKTMQTETLDASTLRRATSLPHTAPAVISRARLGNPSRPRRLLLCLDGVPFTVLAAARARGMFEMFHEPSRLLSPFPTMTNVALSTMLRATPPLGYESLYFDSATRKLAGGVSKYVGRRTPDKIPSSYMDTLDYQEPLPCEFLVYFAPDKICLADVLRFSARFNKTPPQQDFFAFLKATDGLLHICGAERLQAALVELDRVLRDVCTRYGADTEIVLFSDHGMNLEENHRVPLRKHLERHGFIWTNHLEAGNERQVVVPAFGLCGYVALYCANERAAQTAAATLATLDGIDFSLTRDGAAALVTSARGTARIRRRTTGNAVAYVYQPHAGDDPLALNPIKAELDLQGALDLDGYASADAWFTATARHTYPDALANLYGALFDNRVAHTADVLVSLHDGYYYGATAFAVIARRLLATHGNALAGSSTAFLASTHQRFPAIVRACDAEPLLRN